MKLTEIVSYLDGLLRPENFSDDSNNGLQVEGHSEVRKVGFAVDACAQTFEMALDAGCDLLFCHHGISWGGGIPRFTGYHAIRLRLLLANGLSLYAMHLPLDAHPTLGNNAQLCNLVGLTAERRNLFGMYHGQNIGFAGELKAPLSCDELAARLENVLLAKCRLFCLRDDLMIRRIAIVSGGGIEFVDEAVAAGCDTLLTGEMKHEYYHRLREQNFCVLAAGHYATETTGPFAVMHQMEQEFPQLECTFLNCPTGL